MNFLEGFAQEISIHPTPKIDTVWYSDVTEDSKPKSMSCKGNNIGYFRLKFNSEIVIDDFKKETIKTKKEDWEKEDEDAFDEKYNKEKKKELDDLENEFIEEDEGISEQALEEINRFIDINWNGGGYSICKSDCESPLQQCYIYHEITQLVDHKKTYKYRTAISWLETKDDGDNEVEIDLELVIEYKALIYFFVTCSCDDIPGLLSVNPSRQLNDSNPWSHIDLLGDKMKPGYPFVAASKSLPTLPIVGGLAATGGIIYLLSKKEEEIKPCVFTLGFSLGSENCGDQTGSASVLVNQPEDYNYLWSSGQTTQSINNVSSGLYSVTITPAGTNCPRVLNLAIPGSTNDLDNTPVTTTPSECGLSNGSANIVNPSSDVSYSWSNGTTGNSATELAGGDYTVTATKGACVSVITFSVIENNPTFIISSDVELPTCGLDDGYISVSLTPESNYSYNWSNGETNSTISSIGKGSYEVTVTDTETGCSKTVKYNLNDKAADLNLNFTSTDATCGISDGSISVEIDPPGAYSFLWSNGETTQSISDKLAGEYSVTVTLVDSECSVSGNSKIEEKSFPLEIEYLITHPNCGLSDGEVTIQLTPSGMYTFDWSNGQTTQNISTLPNGDYSVTITDQNGCSAIGQTQLEDKTITYIENIESSPGDCIKEGEITITLATPGEGPIITIINGPNSQETIFLDEGSKDLSPFADLSPGTYSIEVYDQNAGPDCSQNIDIVIEDNTPNLSALDDNYETGSGETVSGNAFDNDAGLNITINATYNIIGGTTMVETNGEFQFTPADDFEGEASFIYVIEDACGVLDTATVHILVIQIECIFTSQFDIEAASCGLEDGSALVSVDPAGNYSYVWSDGATGALLVNAGGGMYDVTITDNDLECNLTFEVIIPENEPSYISNEIVIQPSCAIPADIQFELTSSSSGPFLVTITHPNGIDAFVVLEGVVLLSDYISIITGTYTISIYDSNAGPECSETFSVLIQEPTELTITLIEIIPPSSISANDGAVVIEISSPGIPPYDIWVNGVVWDQTTEVEFIINGLSVGGYSIFITDAVGCTSNEIELFIPPPMILPIKVGVGLVSHLQSLQETSQFKKLSQPLYFIELEGNFTYFGINNSTALRLIVSNQEPQFSLSHLLEIAHFRSGKIRYSLKGGMLIAHHLGAFKGPAFISEISGNVNIIGPLNFEMFVYASNESHLPLNIGFKLRY